MKALIFLRLCCAALNKHPSTIRGNCCGRLDGELEEIEEANERSALGQQWTFSSWKNRDQLESSSGLPDWSYCTDIHDPQRTNPSDFSSTATRAATISSFIIFSSKMSNIIWFEPLKFEDLFLFFYFWFYKWSSLKQAAQICRASWAWFDINGRFTVVMSPLVALVTLNKAEWCSMTVCWTDMKVARR